MTLKTDNLILSYIKRSMYCVKCKKTTDTSNVQYAVSKNGRNMKQGMCIICGTTKTQFIKAHNGGSLLIKAINNYLSKCIFRAITLRDPVLN